MVRTPPDLCRRLFVIAPALLALASLRALADEKAPAQPAPAAAARAQTKATGAALDETRRQKADSTAPTDAQEAALDREARQLAMKIRSAKPDELSGLRRQLEQLTERHFERRQQRRKREIDDLGHRLDKLRVTHHRREENKVAVIQRRVQYLLDPNADLRWEEPSKNEDPRPDAAGGVSHVPVPKAATTNSPEPTFDGTPYSQWLTMLETERKPEKLASAMEACSRLVVKGDEQRIVRGILAAARLFDATENDNDRNVVWGTGQVALRRLLIEGGAATSDTVAEELLAHVSDPQMAESPGFVGVFFVYLSENKPIKVLQTRAPAFVSALVRHHVAAKEFDPRLAAAATAVWMHSGSPIKDFEGLHPLVLKGYDNDLTKGQWARPWSDLPTHKFVAEVPEIVTILGRHLDKHPDHIVHVLGTLGPAAKPTVPKLVERLVAVWKSRDDLDRIWAAGKDIGRDDNGMTWESRMRFVLNTLRKIGPGATPAVPVLKEFLAISPAKNEEDAVLRGRCWLSAEINETLLAIGDTADGVSPETPQRLSDFCHLAMNWKLASSRPGQPIPNITLKVGYHFHLLGQPAPLKEVVRLPGCRENQRHYVIDESTTPKQITLVDKNEKAYQQFGIYEMKGDRLKIEFTKPGLPRPNEFSADREQLPEGHVLLEFERDRGEE